MKLLREYQVGSLLVRYMQDASTGQVGLTLIPSVAAHSAVTKRKGLAGLPYIDAGPESGDPPATVLDPLVHLKLVGDWYGGAFSQGRTMRGSASNDRFALVDQVALETGDQTIVTTTLASIEGLELLHRVSWHLGDDAIQVSTEFRNRAESAVKLEMLSSFSLGGITPFHESDAPSRLQAHRYRSVWSAEGRQETLSLEQLHLERSWSGAGAYSERFGQVGSMPVRGFFPFVAVTDAEAQVTWAAQLAWAGSWQLEVFRQHDDVCLSGGLADREFGHWMKTVRPGESFTTPTATLTCVAGGLAEACDALVATQQRGMSIQPAVERDLPIVFNEWCTTWGDPSHDKLVEIADRLRDSDVTYLVIDAGWYKTDRGEWGNAHGDWTPSPKLFPDGLKATADEIRDRGLIPGLWFEMETVGSASHAWHQTDWLLRRDGLPISVRDRRFWDLNHPDSVDQLARRVIDQIREGGFGYLKVDYNETIGLGVDHPDGLGEGLRQQVEGVYRFFDRIRSELPDLVIENCSSGGHRLEPGLISRTAMSSFSDAHELEEIPLIAANLHELMLPAQSQIWAVLRPTDSNVRMAYLLTATFLGRMCLSGDIVGLNDSQWTLIQRATGLYRRVAPIIRDGQSRRYGQWGESWRYPSGWQAVVRVAKDGSEAIVVAHAFAQAPASAEIQLPDGGVVWRIDDAFPAGSDVRVSEVGLRWNVSQSMIGIVVHLVRAEAAGS